MKTKKDTDNANFLKIIYVVVFVFSLLLPLSPIASNNANAAIVKCGIEKDDPKTTENEAYENRCTLCDLIIGIKDIIDWGKNILVVTALAIITIGGVVYIISAGNDQMMETAKNIITQAVWGVAIVLGAWLIVNTGMWLLGTKDKNSDGGVLGIEVTSWNEFDCIGEKKGSVIVSAVCSKKNKYECETPGSSVINQAKNGYKYTWQCEVLGNKTNCEYTESVCSTTANCNCLSGDPVNCSGYTWTCKTANEEKPCDAMGITPACDENVKYKCTSGMVDPDSIKFDENTFIHHWNCIGNGTATCSYAEASCSELFCECKFGSPSSCVDTEWKCKTANEEESCNASVSEVFSCADDGCTQANTAIKNNASGVDPNILKAIVMGGEGCNKSLSKDGFGSCGYSQALPKIRAWCGITGTAEETCAKVQNNIQLDMDCAAKLIKEGNSRCNSTDINVVASCYNAGQPGRCAQTTNLYCNRVSDYLSGC